MDITAGETEKEFNLRTDNSDKKSEASYIEKLTVTLKGSSDFNGIIYTIGIPVYNPDKPNFIINPYTGGKEGEEKDIDIYLSSSPTSEVKLNTIIQNTSLSNTLLINYGSNGNVFKRDDDSENKYYKVTMKLKMEDDKKFTEALHVFNLTFCIESNDINYVILNIPNLYYIIEEITPAPATLKSPIVNIVTPYPATVYQGEEIDIIVYLNLNPDKYDTFLWYLDGKIIDGTDGLDIPNLIVSRDSSMYKYLVCMAKVYPVSSGVITNEIMTPIRTAVVEKVYLDSFTITLKKGEREKCECTSGDYTEVKEVYEFEKKFNKVLTSGTTAEIIETMTDGVSVLGDKCINTKCIHGKCNKENGKCQCNDGYEGDYCSIPANGIDGGWSEYSEWSECDVSCGVGTQTRTRKCNNPEPKYGGKDCVGSDRETRKCEKEKCVNEIDGGWSEWSEYSKCSAKCGIDDTGSKSGYKARERKCNNPLPSENGKRCEGESVETVECSISCNRKEVLCPGTVIDIDGKVIVKGCNGNGQCKYNNNNTVCYEGEPNCYVYCECNEGYYGLECNMNKITYRQRKSLRDTLLEAMSEKITTESASSSNIDSCSSLLKDLSSSVSEIDSESLKNIKKSIDNSIKTIKKIRRSRRLRAIADVAISESVKNLLHSTSNIISCKRYIENVAKDDGDMKERILNEETVNNSELDQTIHSIIEDENEFDFTSENFGIKVVSSIESNKEIKDNNGGKIEINEETLEELKELGTISGLEMINYNENLFKDSNTKDSSLLTINIRSNNGKELEVKELNNPIMFTQRLSGNVNLKEVTCSYYDETTGHYTTNGTYIFEIYRDDNGDVILSCGTIHLSKFSGFISKSVPKMNVVNPITDAKLLFKYNNSNITIPLVFSGIIILFFVCWVIIYYLSKKQREVLEEERFQLYLKRGKIEEDKSKIYSDEKMPFCKKYFEIFKREYHYANVFIAPISAYTIVSRSERMLILLATILTNFAVLALFYGSESENLNQMLGNGIISCLCMLPVTIILPRLFYYANNFTLRGLKKKEKKSKKAFIINPTICKLLCSCCSGKKEKEFSSIPISDNIDRTKKENIKENNRRRREILNLDNWYIIMSTVSVILSIVLLILGLCVTKFNLLGIIIGVIMVAMILCNFHGIYGILRMDRTSIIGNIIEHVIVIVFLCLSLGVAIPLASDSYNNSFIYKLWQFGVKSPIFKEITDNIESELNCCGYNEISDYNSHGYCLDNDYILNNNEIMSCKRLIFDKMNVYSMIMIFSIFIYLLISIILIISDLMMFRYNKNKIYSLENNSINDDDDENGNNLNVNSVYDVENDKRYKSVEDLRKLIKIQMSFKKYLLNSRIKRRNEYKLWYEQKRIRKILSICAFIICFVYLVMVIYIDLLYGVKFSSSQSKHWIISCIISFVIDMIIQEPCVILAKSVAGNVGLMLLKAIL